MLAKLLAMLAQAKGASIAIVVTVSAATATVGAATPEVQNAVRDIASAVGLDLTDTHGARTCADDQGQPEIVAQRNAADKLLRAAFEVDHKALTGLRGGKDQDGKLVGDVVRNYDDQLRGKLNKALVDVAALTLGREGQVGNAESACLTTLNDALQAIVDKTTEDMNKLVETATAEVANVLAPVRGNSGDNGNAPADKGKPSAKPTK
jgi:hypothetical protein